LLYFCTGAAAIAIDAPSEPSTAPHAGDTALAPKFRPARCGEIALGRQWRVWVSWVTPTEEATCSSWMRAGFSVWRQLTAAGHTPIETYPYACFTQLAGQRLPRKATSAGRIARGDVLRLAGIDVLARWSHDHLDAAIAALVARHAAEGMGVRVSCDHDGSAIWLPSATGCSASRLLGSG
jgi:predicted nuclease with RNAse H fold